MAGIRATTNIAAGGIPAPAHANYSPRFGKIGARAILLRLETYRRKLTQPEPLATTDNDDLLFDLLERSDLALAQSKEAARS